MSMCSKWHHRSNCTNFKLVYGIVPGKKADPPNLVLERISTTVTRNNETWYMFCFPENIQHFKGVKSFNCSCFRINVLGSHRGYSVNPWLVNTLRLKQNGTILPEDIFKCIYLNKNFCISIEMSLKFIPKVSIDSKSALVQIRAWCQTGVRSLPEPMLTHLADAYAARGGDESTHCPLGDVVVICKV